MSAEKDKSKDADKKKKVVTVAQQGGAEGSQGEAATASWYRQPAEGAYSSGEPEFERIYHSREQEFARQSFQNLELSDGHPSAAAFRGARVGVEKKGESPEYTSMPDDGLAERVESTARPIALGFPANKIIFLCNSELDGFKEGDGDLMDKLTTNINLIGRDKGFRAVRVVQNILNAPTDKDSLSDTRELEILDKVKLDKCDDEPGYIDMQNRFLRMLEGYPKNCSKILYIGSRVNVQVDHKDANGDTVLNESGSLFTKTFIQRLQREGIMIVVCCLEYKFFKRSVAELPRALEMLKQQLFVADGIHF